MREMLFFFAGWLLGLITAIWSMIVIEKERRDS